jgi:Protein of unknown function (DUF3455)
MFNKSLRSILFTTAAAITVAACGGAPEEGSTSASEIATTSDALRAPVLPSPTLAVPAGNRAAFAFDAIGVQIYACSKTATGFGWVFQAPEATLYKDNGKATGSHYVGPTWEFKDGSKVVGAKVAGFTADPTAIPELLLKAVSHDGDGRMSGVTYIQRLDTVGGLAPASGCDASTPPGTTARVDYTATYFFYEASDGDD